MKNFKEILKAAACSAAGILIMTGCTNYSEMLENEPQEYVSLANENTTKAIVKDSFSEEYKLLDEALKDGSFKLEFEAEGIKFSGECYVNEKDEMSSQMYTLTGSKGTSAQIYAFTGKNIMKLGTIGNSGTHIYSFDLDTLEDKLASSIFDPDSGSSYAMSEEDYKMFLEYAAELDSAIKGEKSEDDTYSVYQDIINAYIDEHPPITSEKAEATINGETVEANIVQYDLSKEDLRSLAEQLVDKAVEQEKIYEEYGYTKEEFKSEIMSELDELEDYSIQLVYYINSKTNELMQIDIALSMADKPNEESDPDDYFSAYYNRAAKYDASINIVYGADPANAEKQSITAEFSTDYYDNSYYEDSIAGFNVDIFKSEDKTEVVITLDDGSGEITELATITSEKNGENYSVTAKIPELEATAGMTGTIVKDKDSFEMTIDRLFLNYGSTELAYLPKAVISVKKGGEMLNLDAEKEFLDITEEEMDALIENIESDFEAVFMEFAEDSTLGKSMLNYIAKSKRSSANAYAKSTWTAIATKIVMMTVDDEKIETETVTGFGNVVTINGKDVDLSDYLTGYEGEGYIYAELDAVSCSINYALWSEEPIPDKYTHQLSYDEQESLMNEGIYIGCYPLNSNI